MMRIDQPVEVAPGSGGIEVTWTFRPGNKGRPPHCRYSTLAPPAQDVDEADQRAHAVPAVIEATSATSRPTFSFPIAFLVVPYGCPSRYPSVCVHFSIDLTPIRPYNSIL